MASSSVAFPLTESPKAAVPQPRPTYLPFRRISLPTAPTLMHRQSVVSVASFDSLPEEQSSQTPVTPVLIRNINPRRSRGRTSSIEGQKRNRRRDNSSKPKDSAQEVKRRKIIQEFYETEKAYVDGLELIYSQFLTPIIASLDTPQPLLDRAVLTSIFSNFIDIWNLHRSFFSALTTLLFPGPIMTNEPLSPLLLSHFPYLSLYTPFITAFPTTISSILGLITPPSGSATQSNPQYSEAFATFLAAQEADPRCGRLKLRDWLLTIVQRCPRYLLLLKDLIGCTDPDDPEHEQLTAVHTLVSKITLSLNTSLHTHAQTLSLLAIQRATPNLPFQLIVPGRTLLKRGPLVQVERSEQPREREFLLFSDCLIWLASEESERGNWKSDWGISSWTSPSTNDSPTGIDDDDDEIPGLPDKKPQPSTPRRPKMTRTRSKSEAEVSMVQSRHEFLKNTAGNGNNNRSTPNSPMKSKSAIPTRKQSSNVIKRQGSNTDTTEKWIYKGRSSLVDLEVVIPPNEPTRFEILSPEGSFVLYSSQSKEERDEWCMTIRQAKAQLMVSLNVTNPHSTLTSSESMVHVRRALQALPFPPDDERNGSISQIRGRGELVKRKERGKKEKEREKKGKIKGRRGRVEHWVPAIWIPDEKAQGCMRCGRSFGWRRRRHHCRLCGRCVCAACSDRTFFIADPNNQDKPTNPARACTACYETVFPLLDPLGVDDEDEAQPPHSPPRPSIDSTETHTNSISNFPSWLSMPSLPLTPATPDALMGWDFKPKKPLPPIDDDDDDNESAVVRDKRERLRRIRASNASRPRSFVQILGDFQDLGGPGTPTTSSPNRSQVTFDLNSPVEEDTEEDEDEEDGEGVFADDATTTTSGSSKRHTVIDLRSSQMQKQEDTARRNKRFSMPAVALQTTSVTARTQQETIKVVDPGAPTGQARSKRFSLVLGGRNHFHRGHSPKSSQTHTQSEMYAIRKGMGEEDILEEASMDELVKRDLSKGVAAGKLSELLGRKIKL